MKTQVDFLKKMTGVIAVAALVVLSTGNAEAKKNDEGHKPHAGVCTTCPANSHANDIRDNSLESFLVEASMLKVRMIHTEETVSAEAAGESDQATASLLLKASGLFEKLVIMDDPADAIEMQAESAELESFLISASGLMERPAVDEGLAIIDNEQLELFLIQASGLKTTANNQLTEADGEMISMN